MAFMQIYNALFLAKEEDTDSEKDKNKDNKADKADKAERKEVSDEVFSCAAATFSLEEVKVWITKQSAGLARNGTASEYCHGQYDL